jgi:hypothetical protein
METAQITDLYQASYFLLSGCELVGIECIPTGGAISCRISFRGEHLEELTQQWWDKQAVVNLWTFRSAYSQVNGYVHQAKKSYDLAARRGGVQ